MAAGTTRLDRFTSPPMTIGGLCIWLTKRPRRTTLRLPVRGPDVLIEEAGMNDYVESAAQYQARLEFAELFRQVGMCINVMLLLLIIFFTIVTAFYGLLFVQDYLAKHKNEEEGGS